MSMTYEDTFKFDLNLNNDNRIDDNGKPSANFFHSFRLGRYAVNKDYQNSFSIPPDFYKPQDTDWVIDTAPIIPETAPLGAKDYRDAQYSTLLIRPTAETPSWYNYNNYNYLAENKMGPVAGAGGSLYLNNKSSEACAATYKVNDWVYDKVAIGIYVSGINQNFQYVGKVALKEFYDNPLQIDTTNIIGYVIRYDFPSYGEGRLALCVPNTKGYTYIMRKDNSHVSAEYRTGWFENEGDTYYFTPTDILIGGTGVAYATNYVNNINSVIPSNSICFGSDTFEGLTLVDHYDIDYQYTPTYINWNGSLDFYDHPLNVYKRFYVLNKARYNANAFYEDYTLEDIVNMALSFGLPVLASASAIGIFGSYWTRRSLQTVVESSDENAYNYVFIPKIANGQIDREEYYRGKDILNSPLYQASLVQKEKSIDDEDFTSVTDLLGEVPDPSDIDTNTYVTEIELNEPAITPVGIFSRWYALTEYDTLDLFRFLFVDRTTAQGTAQFNEIIEGLKLMGENPMDFIISLRMYPFSLNDYVDLDNNIEIGFGNGVSTGVIAEKINFASVVLDCGKVKFPKYHKNFLDYSPYTDAKLYIPYCGEVSIDTSVYVGAEINVKMIVDITTGMCCAVVYKDGIPAIYKDGHIGMDIQMTGTDSYALATAHLSQIAGIVQGAISAGVGAKSATSGITNYSDTYSMGAPTLGITHSAEGLQKNWIFPQSESTTQTTSRTPLKGSLQALGGVGTMIENAFEYYNTPTPLQISGVNSAVTELFKPQYCYLIIQQSVPMNIPNYGNSYGYACIEYRTINSFADGDLIACKNCNITPPTATLPEISEIKQLLESGVWK